MNPCGKRFSIGHLFSLVCIGLLAGCDPPYGVTWLPDSSGFVFVTGSRDGVRDDLQFFDVATRMRRVLVAKTGTGTRRPAISPDGKLIAVARLEKFSHKPASMRIYFFDRMGKEQKRSSYFLWKPAPAPRQTNEMSENAVILPTYLIWEQTNGKLIVVGDGANPMTAAYDPIKDQLVRLGAGLPGFYGGTAVVAGGEGILMLAENLNVVKWDGTRHSFTMDPAIMDKFGEPGVMGIKRAEMLLPLAWAVVESKWEDSTAVIAGPQGTIRIDTASRVATFKSRPESELSQNGKRIWRHHNFSDNSNQLRFLLNDPNETKTSTRGAYFQVELFDPRTNQTRTILPIIDSPDMTVAPNGNLVALRDRDRIRVIDSKGEIIANLDASNEK